MDPSDAAVKSRDLEESLRHASEQCRKRPLGQQSGPVWRARLSLRPVLSRLAGADGATTPCSVGRGICHSPSPAIYILGSKVTPLLSLFAENAVGLALRGRLARARAAVKRHPDYSEHALKRCFADQRPAAVFNCPAQADVV